MKKILVTGILAVQTSVLSACGATFDFDALRRKEFGNGNQAGPFSTALSSAYKNFALHEVEEMYDWIDAAYFGKKANLAAAGMVVELEKPADWWLTDDQARLLSGARKRLMAVLDSKSKTLLPHLAANAQIGFDCWMEQLEENWQIEHIADCRNRFIAAVEQLEDLQSVVGRNYSIAVPSGDLVAVVKAATAVSELPETNSFTLYFSFDKTAINVASHQAIDQVVKAYRSGVPVTISLAGHTDRAGPQPYNFKLSHRRAEAVRKMLIEKGVPVQMITTQAFGEGRPHISTADGVRDEKNRRVEIIVGPASSL